MNSKQIAILVGAVAVSALIVWYDLPLEIPFVIFKALMLVVKLFLVLAVTVVAYIYAGRKKTAS